MATRKTAGPATKGFKITARTASFWRAGLHFGAAPRTVPLAELSPEQAERLREEAQPGGMLVLEEVDIEPVKG